MGEGKSYFGNCLLFPLTPDPERGHFWAACTNAPRHSWSVMWDQVPRPFEQTGSQSLEPSYQPVPIALAMGALWGRQNKVNQLCMMGKEQSLTHPPTQPHFYCTKILP